MFDALIKVGGSLLGAAELRRIAAHWAESATRHRLLIMPGGGAFADQVRAVDQRVGLSDSAAHWMAILAMDQYAYLLADIVPRAALVRDLDAAGMACAAGRLAVLAPSTLVQHADPLPHSWQVTSDSIAAWLAGSSHINRLVLLKMAAGIYEVDPQSKVPRLRGEISRQALAACDVVDPYFVRALLPQTDCWIVDGHHPERLDELLRNGSTLGPRVIQVER